MYNYFMLMGTVCNEIELREVKDGQKKTATICLAVTRDFKSPDGEYITDFIYVSTWEYLAELCANTVKKGSRIGVKGAIVPRNENLASGALITTYELRADRLIYLEPKTPNEKTE